MLKANIISLTVEKYGNRYEENEDSFSIIKSPKKKLKFYNINCAIADGATSTSFSGLWAKLLVSGAVKNAPSLRKLKELINRSQISWRSELTKKDLPWHAQEKIKLGAFSSLLWLRINTKKEISKTCSWKALSIGDSNLLILRNKKLIVAFPIENSNEFGNHPNLLSSIEGKNLDSSILRKQGNWLPGDEFVLATDALAQYFLHSIENSNDSFYLMKNELLQAKNQKEYFSKWISSLRENNEIKNDDSTLIWISTDTQNTLLNT